MKIFVRLMAALALATTLTACGTYQGPHGSPSTGVRICTDVDILSGGVDTCVQAGVHGTAAGGVQGQGAQLARRAPPGALTKAVQNAPDVKWLTRFTTADGAGVEGRHSRVESNESDRGAGYNIDALVTGDSVIVGGKVVPPQR